VNSAHKISHAANAWSKLAGGGEQESRIADPERTAEHFPAAELPHAADEQADGTDAEARREEDIVRGAGQDPGLDETEESHGECERERRQRNAAGGCRIYSEWQPVVRRAISHGGAAAPRHRQSRRRLLRAHQHHLAQERNPFGRRANSSPGLMPAGQLVS
jgi:hypothetical protein